MQKIILVGLLAMGLGACAHNQTAADNTQQVNQKCEATLAARLVGHNDLSEAQIKAATHAQVVRKVGPNQMVTADYREDRVTVLVDPANKKIMRASCG